ncbi:NAD(P)H-dependent oxidoreductase subunit E [Roseiarcaceae bacterium H3SJ34-1]|uniref:NAD(P)H-dependent oxidoreductase subunit E n=1 Tax=Terripilifer ovatus TaxID=3032367 RepID=UPI003AB98C11|nr:NAD(P)H-dependent oxidoreductase subunit E [Roseiarcaceae bacterium H3SJ34-1]
MSYTSAAETFDLARAQDVAREEQARAQAFFGTACGNAAALLPILHRLQDMFGYIDQTALPMIAKTLNISLAEVRGTMSFYHDYRTARPGRHVLKLCRAESCQSMGVDHLVDHLAARHGLAPGETSGDGALTLQNVYCLGNCALSPAALFDERPVGALDAARLDSLIAEAQQ